MGSYVDMSPYTYGRGQTFFNTEGDFVGKTLGDSHIAADKIAALISSKQLTVNRDEKTFSFGTASFDDIWKKQSAELDPSGLGDPSQENIAGLYGQVTQPYINAYKDLVAKGFTPDTTSVNFYNQALLTDVQLKGGTKASLVSVADAKNKYDVYKTSAGWTSKNPKEKASTTTTEKTSRSARQGAPDVAELGQKRRVGAQAASFLGLSSPESKSSILGE